jgi:hypothetical protein
MIIAGKKVSAVINARICNVTEYDCDPSSLVTSCSAGIPVSAAIAPTETDPIKTSRNNFIT